MRKPQRAGRRFAWITFVLSANLLALTVFTGCQDLAIKQQRMVLALPEDKRELLLCYICDGCDSEELSSYSPE